MFTNLATVDFKQLRKKRAASEISKLNDYVASVYENTPKSSDRLFVYALNFLLERLGALSLWKAVEYISISEEGLRLSDLAVLLGEDWCELKFLVLLLQKFLHLQKLQLPCILLLLLQIQMTLYLILH